MPPDEISRGDSSNLDFLRTVAVSMVLFDHLSRITERIASGRSM
jgi:hypothetical protein